MAQSTGAELTRSLVRLRDEAGASVGVGFLVAEGLVCTCAHVVAAALGLDQTPREPPRAALAVEFPFAGGARRPARVQGWLPPQPFGGDLALLRLEAPPPPAAAPAPLLRPRDYSGRPFSTFGLPDGYSSGLWTGGTISGPLAGGWVQLETTRVTGGFSGAPVWDEGGRGVVGVVTAVADRAAGPTAPAWLVPVAAILALAPELAGHLRAPHDAVTLAQLADRLVAQGRFTPLGQLALHPEARALAPAFAFAGVRWSAAFAFSVALAPADGLGPAAVARVCQQFIRLNDTLYHHPQGLDLPWITRFLAYTCAGVLCLVCEEGGAAALLAEASRHQNPAPTYAEGQRGRPWYQDRATSLVWLLDLPAGRLYTHTGRQPDVTNLHALWTREALADLEALLR